MGPRVVLGEQRCPDRRAGRVRGPAGRRPAPLGAAVPHSRLGARAAAVDCRGGRRDRLLPSTADLLTWVALVLVPPGCALALGWAARGGRPVYAGLALPLLAIAWAAPDGRPGQIATTILIAGSAVTLGRLLAGVAPLLLLKAGIVTMAVVDAWLVFSNQLQAPNAVLVAAAPGIGLPQLQSASFGTAGLGYGDFFAAAVVGGIIAAERGPQLAAFALTIVLSLCWDQLFLVYDVLPATVPPALALVAVSVVRRRSPRGRATTWPMAGPSPSARRAAR